MNAEHYQHQIYVYSTDGRFFLCSRGVLVNMEHAEDFDGTDFILRGGKKVKVSRDLAKAAHTAFGDYLFKDFKRRD